jgi:hypothetical protein
MPTTHSDGLPATKRPMRLLQWLRATTKTISVNILEFYETVFARSMTSGTMQLDKNYG